MQLSTYFLRNFVPYLLLFEARPSSLNGTAAQRLLSIARPALRGVGKTKHSGLGRLSSCNGGGMLPLLLLKTAQAHPVVRYRRFS